MPILGANSPNNAHIRSSLTLTINNLPQVKEIKLDYSLCNGCENRPYTEQCTCEMEFNLDSKFKGRTILMYYGLERLA